MTCCRSLQHHPPSLFFQISGSMLFNDSQSANTPISQKTLRPGKPANPQTRKTHRPANIAQLLSMYFPNQDPPSQGPHKFHKSASGVSGFRTGDVRKKSSQMPHHSRFQEFGDSGFQQFSDSGQVFTKFPVLAAIRRCLDFW